MGTSTETNWIQYTCLTSFSKAYFNIFHLFTLTYPTWPLSFNFLSYNFKCISHLTACANLVNIKIFCIKCLTNLVLVVLPMRGLGSASSLSGRGRLAGCRNRGAVNVMLFIPCMLLHRNSSQHMHHLWHISTPTCFGTEVPSSDSHYNKGIQANMPVWVLLLFIGMTEILKC
jgi:hypothetical protein